MTTTRTKPRGADSATYNRWATIAAMPDEKRELWLTDYYAGLATKTESERQAGLRVVTSQTYRLPDDAFRALTIARLRAWLRLPEADAARVATSYDAVLREMDAGAAMRRVATVQTVMRDLPGDEQERLANLNPEERARGLTVTSLGSFAKAGSTEAPVSGAAHSWWSRLLR